MNPDVITFGGDPEPRPATPTSRRRRRLAETAMLVAATGAILLAVHNTSGDRPSNTQPAGPASPALSAQTAREPVPAVHLQLVVPETAAPGEWVTVLAFRDRRLCGPAKLRFDGTPTTHHAHQYATTADHNNAQLFMAMQVPRSAQPGSHEIELYGPKPGGSGLICADVSEHQARLATATISVGSGPS